jgi:hypothetical protein
MSIVTKRLEHVKKHAKTARSQEMDVTQKQGHVNRLFVHSNVSCQRYALQIERHANFHQDRHQVHQQNVTIVLRMRSVTKGPKNVRSGVRAARSQGRDAIQILENVNLQFVTPNVFILKYA